MKASLASSTSTTESDKAFSSMPRGVILLFAIARSKYNKFF